MYKQNLYLQTAIVIFIKRMNQAPLLIGKVGDPLNNAVIFLFHFCKGAKMYKQSFRNGPLRRNGSD